MQRLEPQIEGEHEDEDGDGFIVVRSRYRARDISWRDANEESCPESGTLAAFSFLVLTKLAAKKVGGALGHVSGSFAIAGPG